MAFLIGKDEKGNTISVEVNQGSQLSTSAALLEISIGNVTGYTGVTIEGNNMDIDNTTADIWEGTGDLTYLSVAETMNIVSTLGTDIVDGTGARTVMITGLDGSYVEISEPVDMDGTNNVSTSLSYLRVFSLEVITAGSTGSNEGIITATGSSVQCAMSVNISVSKNSHFTVPLGKNFIILSAELNATKTSGGLNPNISIDAMVRKGIADAPFIVAVARKIDTSVMDQLLIIQPVGQSLDEKSDLKFRATTDQSDTQVRIRYYGVLVDK